MMSDQSYQQIKFWRLARRSSLTAWREFWAPLWSRAQALAFINAVVASILIFQTASLARIIDELNTWVLATHAFGWAVLVWAGISIIREPFVYFHEERKKGKWYGNRFLYNEPELVAVVRCKATGQPQFHKIKFNDAEPNSFVYFHIEVENNPPRHLYSATLVSSIIVNSFLDPGNGAQQGGLKIDKHKLAELLVSMREDAVSLTIRVYMRNFSIGNPEDKDGEEGEFREAFRRNP